ncbi:hypothetical protein ACP4OV_006806 [Aristida adscensionis]
MDSGKKKKANKEERRDRKSATGMSGDPKKGGRGGKFTWEGADGYTDDLHIVSNHTTTAKATKARAGDDDDE